MATPFPALSYSSSSWVLNKNSLSKTPHFCTSLSNFPLSQKSHHCFSVISNRKLKRSNFYVKAEEKSESPSTSSSVAVVSEEPKNEVSQSKDLSLESEVSKEESEESGIESRTEVESDAEEEEKEKLQELDWKTDEDFKKFMGNLSIEAAIKLEKKMTDRKLKELDRETSDNPIVGFFNNLVRDNLSRERERLEKAEEAFKALDLNKVLFASLALPSDTHVILLVLSPAIPYSQGLYLIGPSDKHLIYVVYQHFLSLYAVKELLWL